MKKIVFYIIGLFLLISLSCETKNENNLKKSQKNKKKEQVYINNVKSIKDIKNISDLLKVNSNFEHLFHSISKKEYSVEELKDIVKQDLNYLKNLRQSPKMKRIDTATVMSRLLLTEINLKKMQYLLNKKNIERDTLEKTLAVIVDNLNSAINQISIYHFNIDEFESIFTTDSIQKAKQDSIQKLLQKTQKPNIKALNFKLKKIF